MFDKILVANRGEIAVRIIRACREMGILTVAVYSEADKEALHVLLADEAVCIGPGRSRDSYLNIENIISATILTGASAIHPGFGFLSENDSFARICEECNIVFIGPKSSTIEMLGNKSVARQTMKKAKINVIPGSNGEITSVEEAKTIGLSIGLPVLIKASCGGGGKGMRVVKHIDEMDGQIRAAKAEAKAAFGDDRVYMEKIIKDPKHIEFQILADKYGQVIHLGERDCSMQRGRQKVLEEAPSSVMDDKLRQEMGGAAVRAAQATGYENAGTIEFLVDNEGKYYFMEMNTRIQVEHPVTEMITGIDMIKEQIKIASGKKLEYKQDEIKMQGHSIECRINAQDPSRNFIPSPGVIGDLLLPGGFGVRVDTAIYPGYTVSPIYDSMLAKIIVHGHSREEAISRMKRALVEFAIEGIHTNAEFLYDLIEEEDFITGKYNINFIEDKYLPT